jgi:hypothetical protein
VRARFLVGRFERGSDEVDTDSGTDPDIVVVVRCDATRARMPDSAKEVGAGGQGSVCVYLAVDGRGATRMVAFAADNRR